MSSDRERLPIRIGERRYEVEVAGIQRQFIAANFQTVDQGMEADERSLANQGIWKRSVLESGWGAGQKILDIVGDSDRKRFHDSRGVNVWDRYELKLLRRMQLSENTGDVEITHLLEVPGMTYAGAKIGEGIFIAWTRSDFTAEPAITIYLPTAPILTGLACDNTYVYEGAGNYGIYRRPVANTVFGDPEDFTDQRLSSDPCWGIWFVNDRLLSWDTDTLYEIDITSGARTAVLTSPDEVISVVGMAQGIFVVTRGSFNTAARIYTLPVNTDDGSLDPPRVVGETIDGERVTFMVGYGSLLAVGSQIGLRFYEVSSNDQLRMGPMHQIGPVSVINRHGNFVYAVVNDEVDACCWRFHLGRANGELQFAYASDVRVEGAAAQGWFVTQLAIVWDGDVHHEPSVLMGGPSTGSDPMGLWMCGPNSPLVSEGWIDYGSITWGTPEATMTTSFDVTLLEPLPAGCQVTALLNLDDQITSTAVGIVREGALREKRAFPERVPTMFSKLRLSLRSTLDGSEGPQIARWTLRAIPLPERVEILIFPILLYPQVEVDERSLVAMGDLYEEYQYLKKLARLRTPVEVEFGQEVLQCYVEDVAVDANQGTTHLLNWTEDRQWVFGVWTVTVVTLDGNEELAHVD